MKIRTLCRCTLFQPYDISAYISTSVSHLMIGVHLSNILAITEVARLGKRLGVRQQAMATAQLYIRRFYSKVEIRRTNPYLVIATAVYLACKMEECPHHIRLVVSEGRTLWPGMFNFASIPWLALTLAQTSSVVIRQNSGSANSFSYPK
jgi:hypothetical protein